jgi:hypothetical protein
MNTVTRSVLIALLTTDSTLTKDERVTLCRLVESPAGERSSVDEPSAVSKADPPAAIRPVESSPVYQC